MGEAPPPAPAAFALRKADPEPRGARRALRRSLAYSAKNVKIAPQAGTAGDAGGSVRRCAATAAALPCSFRKKEVRAKVDGPTVTKISDGERKWVGS